MELKLTIGLLLSMCGKLLIVPYGIETQNNYLNQVQALSFNCTLWN